MRLIVALALCAVGLVLAGQPVSADLPGQTAAPYREAVALWLADDEAAALERLASLAGQGNAAAQMTLALIDKTPALQGPWLSRLPKAERVALMRQPGGLSGRSWMRAAAAQTPHAGLWLALWRPEPSAALAIAFARAGEPRVARVALMTAEARQRGGILTIADDPDYPPSLRVLAWAASGATPDADEIATLDPGDPQRAWLGETVPEAALAEWLLSAPEAGGLAALCRSRCPATVGACALAGYGALGGHLGFLAFGTPSERLIPAADFDTSPRGEAALLRRMLLNADARGRRLQLAQARARDACMAEQLEAEAQRYMPGAPRD